jgi:hypothetical protein
MLWYIPCTHTQTVQETPPSPDPYEAPLPAHLVDDLAGRDARLTCP